MDVTLPNGEVLRGVPDGTSKQDIINKLKASGRDPIRMGLVPANVGPALTRQSMQEEIASPSGYSPLPSWMKWLTDPNAVPVPEAIGQPIQKFNTGMGLGPRKAALGVKGALSSTGLQPQDQQSLELTKGLEQGLGTAGKVGEFAGDVLMTAPAFGGTAAATRGLPLARRALAQAATGATVGATLAPEHRGTHAVAGGVGSSFGEMLGSALTSGLVKFGPNAEKLLNVGIEPSVGDIMKEGDFVQQALGYPVRAIESTAERIPWLGSKLPLSRMKEEARRKVAGTKKVGDELFPGDPSVAEFAEAGKVLSPKLEARDLIEMAGTGTAGALLPKTTALAAIPLSVFPRTSAALATGRTSGQKALDAYLGNMGVGPASGYSFEDLAE